MNIAPLIPSEVWLNSQLSLARFYGSIRIDGETYLVDYKTNYLVRGDLAGLVGSLGVKTVQKALRRFGDTTHTKRLLDRLKRLIKAQKKASMCNDSVLF